MNRGTLFESGTENGVRSRQVTMVLFLVLFIGLNILPKRMACPLIVLSGFGVLVVMRFRLKRMFVGLAWPLLVIVVVGMFGVFGHEWHHVLRDIVFSLAVLSAFFIGFSLAQSEDAWIVIVKAAVVSGVILAFLHLLSLGLNPELLGQGIRQLRKATRLGSLSLVTLALVLVFFRRRPEVDICVPRCLPTMVILPLLFLSFALSYSRSQFGVAVIFVLTLLGVGFNSRLRSLLVLVSTIVGILLFFAYVPFSGEKNTFLQKLRGSLEEMKISDFETMAERNRHWRGFETYRTIRTFDSGNIFQKAVGHGFGALTDLGLEMELDGRIYRFIPVMHNGYAYVLLKTGILGLFLYALFWLRLIIFSHREFYSNMREQAFLSRLVTGILIALSFLMWVVGGVAQGNGLDLLLLAGALIRQLVSRPSGQAAVSPLRSS